VTEKQRFTEPEVVQADGVTDDQTVTSDADVAEVSEVGQHSGLPMEPPEEKAARLERELDEVKDKLLRLAAEFDNFRKRVTRERAELSDRAQASFATRLLDVLDDLDRLESDKSSTPEALHDATLLINRKLRKELEASGLELVEPAGTPFDPTRHEAVSILPPPTPEQDHTVSATFQPGYTFKGTLIRPARVQVYSDQGQA
jgi:molecular chaperone GrpE